MSTAQSPMRATTWQRDEAPQDRGIFIDATISAHDDISGYCYPYAGYAEWSAESGIWLDRSGMAICESIDETLRVHAWIDLPEVLP